MRTILNRFILTGVLLFSYQFTFAQNQVELVPDQLFLKLHESVFSQAQRSNTIQVLEVAGVSAILSQTSPAEVVPAFTAPSLLQEDPYGLQRIFVVNIQAGQDVLALIDQLNTLPDVEYAEAMYIRELYESQFIPNDALYSQSWHHPIVSNPQAWDIQTGSDTIIIAIIDTGVDTDHPDLVDNLWVNPGEIPDNLVDDDGNGQIDDIYGWDFNQNDADVSHQWDWHPYNAEDHGTHCAGIAAGVTNNLIGVAGASHHSKIMTCKIFPYLSDTAAANAILYAANNGAHVISNSWGGGGSSATIQAAILHARNVKGSIVLFAAGNSGSSSPHYPGANDGVVCVGASNSIDGRASFSNYGSWVDMCAPGTNIWSATDPENPAHNDEYQAWDGTSMATPLAAGIAALIKSQYPSISVEALETRLMDGDNIGNLQMGLRVNALKGLTSFNLSHSPLTYFQDLSGPIEINAETFAEAGNALSLTLHYSISGSAFITLDMSETTANSWSALIPAQPNGTIIEYYIHAIDGEGNSVYQPYSAPEIPNFFLVGSSIHFPMLVQHDAESDQGWALGVAEDDASSGTWVREDPIGTWEGSEPVQPEDDHSQDGTMCFVTGNAPFTGSNSGTADVDGGRTTLVSPIFYIPTGITPVVSYWRWYTNNLGFSPGEDNWLVEMRDQNNIWVPLEQTSQSENSWNQQIFLASHYFDQPTQLQLRFIAEDQFGGSLVEAALDDLQIFYNGEITYIPGDVNLDNLIGVQDLIMVVAHILGTTPLEGNAAVAADFNLDSAVNVQDVITLVSAILGD